MQSKKLLLHFRTPPIVIDDSSWKNAAESFTVALTLTLGGYESAIAPFWPSNFLFQVLRLTCRLTHKICHSFDYSDTSLDLSWQKMAKNCDYSYSFYVHKLTITKCMLRWWLVFICLCFPYCWVNGYYWGKQTWLLITPSWSKRSWGNCGHNRSS